MNRELKMSITDFTDVITLTLPDNKEIKINIKGIGNHFTDKKVEVTYTDDDKTKINSVFNVDNPSQSKCNVLKQPGEIASLIRDSPLTTIYF